jgi:hypothetical protein
MIVVDLWPAEFPTANCASILLGCPHVLKVIRRQSILPFQSQRPDDFAPSWIRVIPAKTFKVPTFTVVWIDDPPGTRQGVNMISMSLPPYPRPRKNLLAISRIILATALLYLLTIIQIILAMAFLFRFHLHRKVSGKV